MKSKIMTIVNKAELQRCIPNWESLPSCIKKSYRVWENTVETEGIPRTRGYYCKKLQKGWFSVRLSNKYRIRFRFVDKSNIEVTHIDNHYNT